MKLLITGTAGFIGYSLALRLLEKNRNIIIFGLDNFSNYYSLKLKKKRINILKKYKNFKMFKIDLHNEKKVKQFISKNKFDIVFHFAAQAGVRYTQTNPGSYIKSNIIGFYNLIESIKVYQPKFLFYASSSSVYGETKKFPTKENFKTQPLNIYSLSKKNNEEMVRINLKNFKTKFICLRFFTVFGEWGRPDMFIFKLLDAILKKKLFYLNNYGNHQRDFTYIEDAIDMLENLYKSRNKLNKHEVFNVCSNNPQNIIKIKNKIISLAGNCSIKKRELQKVDVSKTHGCNKKILKFGKLKKLKNFNKNLENTIIWYLENKNLFK